MKEDLLNYLWQFGLFLTQDLKTELGESIEVISKGIHNTSAGPDFFNAKIRIGNQLWAGNVEIHLKSSDWYVHHHETDANYDNVILHVVWNHDLSVYNSENNEIPTLELQAIVSKDLLNSYHSLFSKQQKWINCEKDISSVDDFVISNWKERLYLERLEQKADFIVDLLHKFKNDWEAVLFVLLAKNFGLKVNADAFFEMALRLDFSIIRKEWNSGLGLESLFFGELGMLNSDIENPYYYDLKKSTTI